MSAAPLRRVWTAIGAWWWAPAPARRLAAVRLLTGMFVLKVLWQGYGSFASIARTPPDRWHPMGPFVLFDGPLDPATFDAWNAVHLGLAVCFVAGFAWRILSPIYAVSTVCYFAYRNVWGGVLHADNLFTLHVVCLAFGPAAAAWSVDAWIERRWPGRWAWSRWGALPAVDAWFGWNLKLVGAVTTLTYMLAGVAKLASDPENWATGKSLLDQIGNDAIFKELVSSGGATAVVPWAYQHPQWLLVPAVMTLVLETAAPLALLDRRLGWVWSFSVCCMHHGIALVMGIVFPYPVSGVAFASFFPVDSWVEGAGRLLVRAKRRVVRARAA